MKLAVLILNWNAELDTDRCLRSVRTWRPSDTLPEPTTWVVDNSSKKESIDWLQRNHPGTHFLLSELNRGFAGGNNLGIEAALADGSEAILLLNNDASIDDRSVVSMLRTLASGNHIGTVGPTLWHGEQLLSAGGRDIARHGSTHLRPQPLPTAAWDVDYVPGTVALVGREVFASVGTFDEDYFFGGEMADLCLRARRQGLRCVIDPQARASHDLDRSSEIRDTLHVYYVYRNRFLYIQKHHPQRRISLASIWTLRALKSVAVDLIEGRYQRAWAVWMGLRDGLAGRFGGQNDRVLS